MKELVLSPEITFPAQIKTTVLWGLQYKWEIRKDKKAKRDHFCLVLSPATHEVKPIRIVREPLPTEPGHLGLLLPNTTA